MAVGDQGSAPVKKPFPLWIILVGGGGLALFLYLRNRNAAQTQQPLVPAVTTDPNTGLPVDPLTGLPFQGTSTQPQTLDAWTAAAESWASGHHLNPALVAKALFDYENGNRFNEAEAEILRKIIAAIGYAPGVLPWNGPTGNSPTPKGKGPFFDPSKWKWASPASWLPRVLSLVQGHQFLFNIGEKGTGNIELPRTGAPIYALVLQKNGQHLWQLITSAAQYRALPNGTRIASEQGYVTASHF